MRNEYLSIGENVFIGEGVVFGDNVKIGNNVIIYENTIIGNNVVIMDNTVIGKNPTKAKMSILPHTQKLPPSNIGSDVTIGTSSVIYVNVKISNNVFVADLATIRERVCVGENTIVGRGVAIENDTEIGTFCKLETNCYITAYSIIEDYVFIAPCVVFTNDNYIGRSEERFSNFKGPHIKRGARVGANSTILPGKIIHEDGVVAAASVVTKDVPSRKIVMGAPAKVFSDVPIDQLLENQ